MKLAEILEGDLESVIEPLIVEQQTSQLSELNDAL
jgi:peptide chain release factor 1